MFVIKHKFKVGDIVKVVNGKNYCGEILNKICKIIDVIEPPTIDETMYNVSCESVKGTWYVEEDQIVLVSNNYTPSDRLTDPNTNYKELFKEPFYVEFIDIGEALSKLQMFENKETGNVYGECVELKDNPLDSIIAPGDTVFYPSKFTPTPNVHCAIAQSVNPRFVTVVFPSKKTFDIKRSEVFKTYEEALAQIK